MMLNLKRSLRLAGSSVVVALLGALPVLAATPSLDPNANITTTITSATLLGTIFKVVQFAAIVLFVILLLIGGIQYLGSFGNEEATTKARKLILDAVVGLFIVLAAGAIAGIVFAQLGINNTGITGL